jgi:hypothetical protein
MASRLGNTFPIVNKRRPEVRHDREGGQTSGVVGGKNTRKIYQAREEKNDVGNDIVKGNRAWVHQNLSVL